MRCSACIRLHNVATTEAQAQLRRAMLYVPGSFPDSKLARSLSSEVDSVCLDLEDSVTAKEKISARTNVRK
jgi:hypothetical protein